MTKGAMDKRTWKGWEKYGKIRWHCALCEYAMRQNDMCKGCPYYKKFGDCTKGGSPYFNWEVAKTKKARIKFAKEFLKQLKEIKDEKDN